MRASERPNHVHRMPRLQGPLTGIAKLGCALLIVRKRGAGWERRGETSVGDQFVWITDRRIWKPIR